jgi:acyl carrier protein
MPEPTHQELLDILRSVRDEEGLSASSNLVEDGFLNSFDIVLLVTEIEHRYNIDIPGDAIVPENFASLEAIRRMIVARQAEAQ